MSRRRILFVDDEPPVLAALKALLSADRDRWDMVFVADGPAALAELAAGSFNLIVTDLRMPGMDGVELLEQVKALHPGVARVALSGRTDRESVARALTVAQQFVRKPCEADILRPQIDRICELQALLNNESLGRVIGSMNRLPSVPSLYWELTRAVARPEIGVAEIADIVECDPAISAKVLQLVNSAYFGLAQPITSVHQAVLYLGVDLLKALALTAHVFSNDKGRLDGFSLVQIQEQSLLCAQIANRLVDDQGHGDEAYTAGLVHDLGKVVLAIGMPQQFAEAQRTSVFRRVPSHVVEKDVIGITQAEVGAYLLGVWGLPFSIVEAVAYQHRPGLVTQGSRGVLAAVHLADALVDAAWHRDDEAGLLARLDLKFLAEVGLDADLSTWFALAKGQTIGAARQRGYR